MVADISHPKAFSLPPLRLLVGMTTGLYSCHLVLSFVCNTSSESRDNYGRKYFEVIYLFIFSFSVPF